MLRNITIHILHNNTKIIIYILHNVNSLSAHKNNFRIFKSYYL